jgi:hypothetical protein
MVPAFKSKTLITDLYSMNPPDSKGVLLFATLDFDADMRMVGNQGVQKVPDPSHLDGLDF